MAKRSGAGNMAGGNRGGGRKRGGGDYRGAAGQPGQAGGQGERMRGGGNAGGRMNREEPESERGMMAGARELAQNFGESTAQTARQFASTAIGAANRTQETVVGAVGGAVGKVRDNPWPSLLIGAGVTWLAVDAIRGRSESESPREESRETEESGPGVMSRTASTIADAGRGAGEYVGDFVRERPLLAGAATLGIGMAIGLALPSTSAEDSFMGNVRDNVVRRAKDAAKGTVEAVRDVAEGVERMAGGERGRERTR